jgi:beta-ureidopropionase / N-carbamoyl-L-amino-acid hydrolase
MPSDSPVLDPDRLWADVMGLAAITDPERPFTRRSFSARFLAGRAWLACRFEEAGLSVRVDTAGNLIGRRAGRDPTAAVVAVGSHTDTVPSGGRFDGIAGVAAGLEIVRTLADAGEMLDHPIEVIDFLAEEPSEYGLSCVGSRGMSGMLTPAMLTLSEPGGERLGDALRRVGGDPDRIDAARRDDVGAFLELHIEQGPLLETRAIDVGLVTSIVGIRRIEIEFVGAADHAGTAPMDLRRDALVAAAATVSAVRRKAEELAAAGRGYFVATVGILDVEPGASNVVPGRSRLVIDARATDAALTAEFTATTDAESARQAAAARVERARFATLSDGPPVACDPSLRTALAQGAQALGFSSIDLASGAGHDAAFMARICPAAMVFIPCRGGKSHAPEEWAEREAIATGGAVMLHAIRQIDRSMPQRQQAQREAV